MAQEPYDWVWVDKGMFLYPETLKKLRNNGKLLIHYLTDDFANPRCRIHYRHYMRSLDIYHVHFTTNTYNYQELIKGNYNAELGHLGFDDNLCRPHGKKAHFVKELASEAAFVGFWRPHLDDYLIPLIEKGIRLRIFGAKWYRSPNRKFYKNVASFRAISDNQYASVYRSTKVGLCFLNRDNRNTSTGRSFEIPAIGCFMLGERTLDHQTYFKEGIEADYFDTPKELLEKMLFYLQHDSQRRKISAAGEKRAFESKYSYKDRMRADFSKLLGCYQNLMD